ncbi:UDP-N-acetylmuramoylalanine--D-glutamate ligase [Terrimicrobium sacchariphilum]|uniref:UDP-N-acetylmuramoylalanine--D-glutamate ligase n=1 Tax=Terrimicrobium sacchariphilum TaxID=690879 RepID=A0A146G9F9_TERSA|nr:UDP-N-acetylmuramoyl-L-alanine--D-glutamate ligase [Terrimicrobium sacchariphilum]GAT34309.1 UDP-N-acetylmuramoylalanine--D-glutamate ligase [Terrimicrobium sacchariphilum]
MIYSGKTAVVLGLGHSGEAAALLLSEEGATVTVCESKETPSLRERAAKLEAQGIKVLFGTAADTDATDYDVCILSPGIDPVVPLVQNVIAKRIPIIGELELAYEECICPVIAITGTNGKTTTTELTTEMLKGCGLRTMSSGNIGLPFATAVKRSHELDVMVLEVSSFQLETIKAFRPQVSAWLNLSPNHLDRYPGMAEYRDAKLRIFENQTAEDFAVVNARDELPEIAAKKLTFSAYTDDADLTLRDSVIYFRGEPVLDQRNTKLPGIHNAENLMAALGMGYAFGLDFDKMAAAVTEYTAPAHRCEFVRTLNGVRFVNDSKATNLDSVEKAILSQEGSLVLIAGGKDKGFEFDPIAPLIRERVNAAVLIGEMKERIAKSWSGVPVQLADTLEEAVEKARAVAQPGDTVLFSPGTSSYDMFRNYGERGNRFKEAVNALN